MNSLGQIRPWLSHVCAGQFIDLQEAAGPGLVNQDYYNAATKDWYPHLNLWVLIEQFHQSHLRLLIIS